jgi:hypothetical protein
MFRLLANSLKMMDDFFFVDERFFFIPIFCPFKKTQLLRDTSLHWQTVQKIRKYYFPNFSFVQAFSSTITLIKTAAATAAKTARSSLPVYITA